MSLCGFTKNRAVWQILSYKNFSWTEMLLEPKKKKKTHILFLKITNEKKYLKNIF